jgi:uncharacterized membrane protein
MAGYAALVSACGAFVATHFFLSHPARGRAIALMGGVGFQIFYSLIAFATLGWAVMEFRSAPYGDPLWAVGDLLWAIATVIMLVASVLLVGSFKGNPALPGAPMPSHVGGVFRVTRHPMMWSFALWSLSHALVSPRPAVLILCVTVAFMALAGAAGQDKKKAVLMGSSWKSWESRTRFWPKWTALFSVGPTPWIAGAIFWLVVTWAHNFVGPYAAGIFRWL